jgi:hypothetical protein
MKRPYRRTDCLAVFICDRFVNSPDHNEEHTQAQVNEFYQLIIQIVGNNPLSFRPILLKTLPRYEVNRGQAHRHAWEKKMIAWEKTLTKKEDEAWRYKIPVCWQSISRGDEDDMRRAALRLAKRRAKTAGEQEEQG